MEQIWDNLPAVAGFAVPFLLVLGLVGLAALLWQRFRTATGSPTSRRGKQSRLAVIDTAAVDARRRLVLIRRDDAEHLIMIGGPTDIVIEPNIGQSEAFSPAREAPAAASPDRPVRRPQSAAAPASPAFEAWSGPRPDPVQAAAREPIVIPQQELRQEAGQRSGQGSSQGRHEEPIPPPASRNPPAPERPAAASAVNTSTMQVRDVPVPTAEVPPAPVHPAVAPRVFVPVFSSVSESAREPVLPDDGPGSPEPKRATPPAQPAAAVERLSAPPPVRPDAAQDTDASLAELAHRLEAALRRPARPVEQQATASPAANMLEHSPANPPKS
jgi:flagellar biogenesis protein FliO